MSDNCLQCQTQTASTLAQQESQPGASQICKDSCRGDWHSCANYDISLQIDSPYPSRERQPYPSRERQPYASPLRKWDAPSQPQSATPAQTHRDRYPTATEDKTEPPAQVVGRRICTSISFTNH
ncbi:MAG: hypothetical protein GDA56_22480 [Hormoscilla sp. GM7CHS1pb]|nr:hypothetical protein [Hormoscilla sp. GM7CHS1pb]